VGVVEKATVGQALPLRINRNGQEFQIRVVPAEMAQR
jgi:hypothetical protein